MPAMRSVATVRPVTFIGALLLSTAFTAPAFAQIETVVVTAERKAEDIQSVPIAVTAFGAADLASHQILQPKDLQFATPSVTYTKTNFTGTNFQIRGIGTQVISGDAEGGIAFNVNDVYYEAAGVDSGLYYDLERVEVLRGPQSTLYGRGATGGAVNVFTAKPHLDEFSASVEGNYGNYDGSEIKGMVNVPIINDELGVRLAADWVRHDGFSTNVNPGVTDHHPDSRDEWSGRASVRWQPWDGTTIDIVADHGDENDTRMRGEKQLCHFDPTGVLGCLPDAVASQPVNLNATFFNIPVSRQATVGAFGAAPPAGIGPAFAAALGLFDLSQPYVAPAGAVPSDPRTINSDFTPFTKGRSNSISAEWKQTITDWLDATLVGGYADGHLVNQESYINQPGANFDPVTLATSKAVFDGVLAQLGTTFGQPNYANPATGPYAFVFAHPGQLPTSNFNNLGIIGGSINRYTSNEFAYDQSNGNNVQKSLELRLETKLDGPLNFAAGVYYLNENAHGDYYVGSNTLDYGQTLFGGIGGAQLFGTPLQNLCISPANGNGCIYGTPWYDNDTERSFVESKSVYGEGYWDIVPDELKLTVGARYTEDRKQYVGRITIFNGFVPNGTTDREAAMAQLVSFGLVDFDAARPGNQNFEETTSKFDKLTGRVVLNWTPKLDWSDQTTVYASYSKGYKAGGANPGIQPNNLTGIPAFYAPESIDAYEIGTKNTFFDSTLQANLTAWYYNYAKYQISEILANTSVNANTNAFLNGVEGEFVWAPPQVPGLQFNLNTSWTETKLGQGGQIDPRNPTGGLPNALLIKDGTLSSTNAQNCVLYYSGSNFASDFATLSALSGGIFFAPPGGTSALAGAGVQHAAFGICTPSVLNGALAPALAFTNFSTQGTTASQQLAGAAVNLQGNQLANTPPWSLSFGMQYGTDVGAGYTFVGRFDYYWQAAMWGRIFNDPADRIRNFGTANLQFTLNSPDDTWYAQIYGRNIFNSTNQTGEYLTSSSSGLYTGAFYGDPRIIGGAIGVHF
ncbi:MAG: TonB-dependent receptor [Rhizomicrobium sp.]